MFTGVGGFELGLQRDRSNRQQSGGSKQNLLPGECESTNQKFRCVGFSEIDKYASELLSQKFPKVKNYGDATKINPKELPDFDMLCGGFPCQAFSIAGKRRGFQDTRGTLFFDIARIIEVKRPQIVLLENVKGLLNHNKGETFRTIIQTLSELGYDVQWMVLNSKFFGVPQNRERVFIVGSIRGTSRSKILPFRRINQEVNQERVVHPPILDINQAQRVYGTDGTSITIKGLGGGQGAKTGLYMIRGHNNMLKINSATKKGYSEARVGDGIRLEYPESKTARGRVILKNSNTLKSGTEGVVVMDLYNKKEHNDRCPALTEPHHNNLRVREGLKIRRLTPTECERLQGFPDGWTEGFSDTQRYKMMGNAVTTNVINAIGMKLI